MWKPNRMRKNEIQQDSSILLTKCGSPNNAYELFRELIVHDTILLNSMITVYSNCGRIKDAEQIFKTMQTKSLISWNSMIVGLSQNGCPIKPLDAFCKMNNMGFVISVCASISSLELDEQIFARATIIGLEFDQIISSFLIDLYYKCGFVENGQKLFDQMRKSDEVSWNSVLMDYATNGYQIEALDLFNEMRCENVIPTDVTFTRFCLPIIITGWLKRDRNCFTQ
ncbi:hypothetical protein ACSBR2_001211 [Camellia fascicularis]